MFHDLFVQFIIRENIIIEFIAITAGHGWGDECMLKPFTVLGELKINNNPKKKEIKLSGWENVTTKIQNSRQ